MNELIMPHNAGVRNALESMNEVLALYKKVTGNYRPMLDGERYLTDREVSEIQSRKQYKSTRIRFDPKKMAQHLVVLSEMITFAPEVES